MNNRDFFSYVSWGGRWLVLLAMVGLTAGTLSAIFLTALDWATDFRVQHSGMVYFLPLVGLLIGLFYHYMGKSVERGNQLVLDQIHRVGQGSGSALRPIPFKMAPMVLIATAATHLFGGSAGREGTALQMSAAAADQFTSLFRLNKEERMILLITALSAGFAAVFGTPLAGAIFGIEVLLIRKFPYKAVLPAVAAAYLGAYVTEWWGVGHTHYTVAWLPGLHIRTLSAILLAGVAFGGAAVCFVRLTSVASRQFKRIQYPPLRPLFGGAVILLMVLIFGSSVAGAGYGLWPELGFDLSRYLGLGIPSIVGAFEQAAPGEDFAFKILLTAITLGAGFKGGEVTPLFFIGATLGSALSIVLPLPVGLLAGMGFVAVFAGAAKTPVACSLMAAELFGWPCLIFAGIACATAYYVSGQKGIYHTHENKLPAHFLLGKAFW